MNLDRLTLQERVLAGAVLKRVGNATVNYALAANGDRIYNDAPSDATVGTLVGQFQSDPKQALGYMRQNLLSIGQDKNLTPAERRDRLGRYFDAYSALTIRLDHAAFAENDNGNVHQGIPDYIPDGFIDMGGEPSVTPSLRHGREQIKVDKAAVYSRYRDTLLEILGTDYPDTSDDRIKQRITRHLMKAVYYQLPYDHSPHDSESESEGVVNLHEMTEGVCRHQALTYQVLAQACGLTSHLVKCHMDGGRHATNATRINHQWYFIDVTNPDYSTTADGARHWQPAAHKISGAPKAGERYKLTNPHSKITHTYTIRNDMYWRMAS